MALNNKFSNTGAKSLLELLQSNSRFIVPKFQRNYSWTAERVNALWSDLLDNFHILCTPGSNEQDAQYLLGPIVLVSNTKKPNTYYVIDGQQRLATLTMLYCAARDIILEDTGTANPKPEGYGKISDLIENKRMGEHASWKLQLNDTDKEFFREIQGFEEGPKTQLERIRNRSTKPQSLKLLQKSYVFLHEKIESGLYTGFEKNKVLEVEAMGEDERRELRIENQPKLMHFLTHVYENNYVVQVMVSDDSSAFQIFETLNERGQTLSKSNLIKNHILNKIEDEDLQGEQSNKWNKIFDEVVGNNQRDDDFIIESYSSRYGDGDSLRTRNGGNEEKSSMSVPKKNLYKTIKRLVTDESTCKKFIKELEQDAEFLSTLNDPTKYEDTASQDDIYSIKALKAKFIRIPILAAHRRWYNDNPREYSKLVNLLVKFFFKVRVVREEHPGKIDNMAGNMTKIINSGRSLEDIRIEIKKYDKHEDFKNDFKKRFMSSPQKDAAKYVLQQITISLGTKYDDVRPIDNLTLEHILPLKHDNTVWNPRDFLKGSTGDADMEEYKKRLGNMTLLKHAINSKISNLPFKLKKEHKDEDGNAAGYNASLLHINMDTVMNHNSWTASTIEKREDEFVKHADKIWNLDRV